MHPSFSSFSLPKLLITHVITDVLSMHKNHRAQKPLEIVVAVYLQTHLFCLKGWRNGESGVVWHMQSLLEAPCRSVQRQGGKFYQESPFKEGLSGLVSWWTAILRVSSLDLAWEFCIGMKRPFISSCWLYDLALPTHPESYSCCVALPLLPSGVPF